MVELKVKRIFTVDDTKVNHIWFQIVIFGVRETSFGNTSGFSSRQYQLNGNHIESKTYPIGIWRNKSEEKEQKRLRERQKKKTNKDAKREKKMSLTKSEEEKVNLEHRKAATISRFTWNASSRWQYFTMRAYFLHYLLLARFDCFLHNVCVHHFPCIREREQHENFFAFLSLLVYPNAWEKCRMRKIAFIYSTFSLFVKEKITFHVFWFLFCWRRSNEENVGKWKIIVVIVLILVHEKKREKTENDSVCNGKS